MHKKSVLIKRDGDVQETEKAANGQSTLIGPETSVMALRSRKRRLFRSLLTLVCQLDRRLDPEPPVEGMAIQRSSVASFSWPRAIVAGYQLVASQLMHGSA